MFYLNRVQCCEISPRLFLFLIYTQADAFPVELEDDNNTLDYYAVGDGCEILMNEVDVIEQATESSRKVEEQERKIREQEREVLALQELQKKSKQGGSSIL